MNTDAQNLLNGLCPETRLFRFMTTKNFLHLLDTKQLTLRRPRLWQDPFEDFLSKTTIVRDDSTIGFDLTKDYFGQCWTKREECDGLWRNYAGQDLAEAVRIETTAADLLAALWNRKGKYASLWTFVGTVEYLDDATLKDRLMGCLEYGHPLSSSDGRGVASTLLIKRTEFSYEHEVRALVSDPSEAADLKSVTIDLATFIKSVRFAPNMSTLAQDALTQHLLTCGVPKHLVSRSSLYDPWTLTLTT